MKNVYINTVDNIPYEALITITDKQVFDKGQWTSFIEFPVCLHDNRCCLVDLAFQEDTTNRRFMEFLIDKTGHIATIPMRYITPTDTLLDVARKITEQPSTRICHGMTLHFTSNTDETEVCVHHVRP